MNDNDYRAFVAHYNIENLRVSNNYSYVDTYSGKYYYYSDKEERIEMSMHRRAFDYLVEMDNIRVKLLDQQHVEAKIRRDNPSVQAAYDKYKMLLELAR